jgi:hypothetical protein
MKVTNLGRKLAASLIAGGLMVPAVRAANLNENLVANPGFENVDINTSQGGYNAVRILDWDDGSLIGYAYSHNGALDGGGATIPDYANGGSYTGGMAPAGTGSFYFTSNATAGDVDGPGQVAQLIPVGTGATGAAIAQGEAAITVSGYFSSFSTNLDFGTIDVAFLGSGGTNLGSIAVSDRDTTTWTLESTAGLVPVGTESLQVSVYGTPLSSGPDGYIDNVDVQIISAESVLLFLEVNTATGELKLRNNTGADIAIDYYEVFSDNGTGNSLQAGNSDWMSLQDQNLAGFPAGNGTGNGWEESGGSGPGVLAESYLSGSSVLAAGAAISLGQAFDTAAAADLTFRYGLVPAGASPAADYNGDGFVDAADYTVWRDTTGTSVAPGTGADGNGDGMVDAADYAIWRTGFGSTGVSTTPGVLTTGFVRYVNPGSLSASAVVPEPTSVFIVSLVSATLALAVRPRR